MVMQMEATGILEEFIANRSPELREKTQQIKQLREELNKTTKEQLIEKGLLNAELSKGKTGKM